MKFETKLIIALGLLMLLAGMAYFYSNNGAIQGRFTTTPTGIEPDHSYEGISE